MRCWPWTHKWEVIRVCQFNIKPLSQITSKCQKCHKLKVREKDELYFLEDFK